MWLEWNDNKVTRCLYVVFHHYIWVDVKGGAMECGSYSILNLLTSKSSIFLCYWAPPHSILHIITYVIHDALITLIVLQVKAKPIVSHNETVVFRLYTYVHNCMIPYIAHCTLYTCAFFQYTIIFDSVHFKLSESIMTTWQKQPSSYILVIPLLYFTCTDHRYIHGIKS